MPWPRLCTQGCLIGKKIKLIHLTSNFILDTTMQAVAEVHFIICSGCFATIYVLHPNPGHG